MKLCPSCRRLRPLHCFRLDQRRPGSYGRCKSCHVTYLRRLESRLMKKWRLA